MKKIMGEIILPGDKSISHRSALFSAISNYSCTFTNFNFNRDCTATLDCLKALGIEWQAEGDKLQIQGKSISVWQAPKRPLHAQNSGTTARLISGILANLKAPSMLYGDPSLSRRPMGRVLDPLKRMGATIESNDNYLPLKFHPVERLRGISYTMPVASAQVKSAVLLAGLFAEGETEVIESIPTRDHTERLLGLRMQKNYDDTCSIFSSKQVVIPDLSMEIPGDFSSAAFFICATLMLPGSELLIKNVSLNPTRTGLLAVLKDMGANIRTKLTKEKPEPVGEIMVKYSAIRNISIDPGIVPNIIDEIPILSILATQAEGTFELHNAHELRVKESDRLLAIAQNLQATGFQLNEYEDGLEIIGPQKLKGGQVQTFGDHRIAMAFAIADLLTDNAIQLDNPDCVDVSFPQFWDILKCVV